MSRQNLSRRKLLIHTLIGATAISVVKDSPAVSEKVNPADPAAKNLGYVEDANTVDAKKYPGFANGQSCANCSLSVLPYGPVRQCRLFPGKIVLAKGWCSAWAKRAPGT